MSARSARRLATAAWLLTVAYAALTLMLTAILHLPRTDDTPVVIGVGIVAALVLFATVGALVAPRQPSNRMWWMFSLFGLLNVLGLLSGNYVGAALSHGTHAVLPRLETAVVGVIGGPGPIVFLVFLMLLFPNGRPASRRWRTVVRFACAACGLLLVLWLLVPGPIQNAPGKPVPVNPLGVGALRAVKPIVVGPLFGILLVLVILGAASLVFRFRSSRGVERQQIKVFAFAGGIVAFAFILGPVYGYRASAPAFLWPLTFLIAILSVPVACGVAILRYRLYDIDRLISRTVSYALITALLIGGYAGLVVLFQATTRPLLGRSDLAIAASTLIVAAMFVPLRRRVQSVVDHRFNRRRYDAERTIEAFSSRLRDEVDMDTLRTELVDVVARTMQPASSFLWLRQT